MEATPQETASVTPVTELPEVKDATANPTTAPAEKKKYKLKVYDQEEEYDEDTVLKMAQKSRAADYKFQRAAELDKARAAWLDHAKKNPWSVFEELGHDADALAEARLMDKIKMQMMTPEQKEAYEAKKEAQTLKKKLEDTESRYKEEKATLEKDELDRLKSEYAQQLDHTIPELFKEKGISATPRRIARVAEFLIAHAETHGKVPDFKQAITLSEKELEKDFQDFLPKMTVEQLLKVLPRELRDGLRKYDLDELKQQNPLRTKDRPAQTPQPRVTKQARMTSDEWFDKQLAKYK